MPKEQFVIKEDSEIQQVCNRLKNIESRLDLMDIILKSTSESPSVSVEQDKDVGVGAKKITQILMHNKSYYCFTPEDERIFSENHPGEETETHKIEILISTANEYVNDPENKKHFTKKVKERIEA